MTENFDTADTNRTEQKGLRRARCERWSLLLNHIVFTLLRNSSPLAKVYYNARLLTRLENAAIFRPGAGIFYSSPFPRKQPSLESSLVQSSVSLET